MVDFIPPLELSTWLIQIFAGTPEIFAAISLLVITSLAAYFRMTLIGLVFIIAMFLLMFSGFINSVLLILIAIIGGLAIGFFMVRIFTR